MRTLKLGNNEQISKGIVKEADGTYTALSYTRSKNFKTKKAAKRFLGIK
jgi:hypothetical protein